MLLCTVSLICVLLVAMRYRYTLSRTDSTAVQQIRHLDLAITVLRDSTLNSRAIPNRRLVTAFGIDNSFTTASLEKNRSFIARVQGLLRTDDGDFSRLASNAMRMFYHRLQLMGTTNNVPLVEMVQVLVLRVVLDKFFPEIPTPSEADALSITRNINIQWVRSKDGNTSFDPTQVQSQRALKSALRTVFQLHHNSHVSLAAESNPLNILLPSYEALWQVVLSGFVQLGFNSHYFDTAIWLKQLEVFLDRPTRMAFDDATCNTSIRYIVAEILRLYPPTKRIKRFYDGHLIDIDVEYLQRDLEIWGNDGCVFKPERWRTITERQEKAYMPFGSGKFVCPSRRVVGPMLIGILVAVLVKGFKNSFEVVGKDGEKVVFGDGLLESGRSAYTQLKLRRI